MDFPLRENSSVLICVARINSSGGSWQHFDMDVCAVVANCLDELPFAGDVKYCVTRDSLEASLSTSHSQVIIFSNFPPDSTYSEESIDLRHLDLSSRGDSYETTASFYRELLSTHANIELHVITGAPYARLPDHTIKSLCLQSLITVRRTFEWSERRHFKQRYLSHVFRAVLDSLHMILGNETESTGAPEPAGPPTVSILILCDQADGFAETIAEQILRAGDDLSPTFSFVHSIHEAHSVLGERYVEALLVLDIPGKWLRSLTAIAWPNPTMAVFTLTSVVHAPSSFPANVTTHCLKPHKSEGIDELLDSFLGSLRTSLNLAGAKTETLMNSLRDKGVGEKLLTNARFLLRKEYHIVDYWLNMGRTLTELSQVSRCSSGEV